MKVKTAELEGVALDWAVAIALGGSPYQLDIWQPSYDWSQGGPLIARYGVTLMSRPERNGGISHWHAQVGPEEPENGTLNTAESPLVAACRAIVATKLGDEVDVPDELCKGEA